MSKMLYDEGKKLYVNGWEDGGKEFTYTEHKGLAQAWQDADAARKALHETIELHENTVGHIVVDATLTPVQEVMAQLLAMSPEDRKDVFMKFCQHCGADHPESQCTCWRDE